MPENNGFEPLSAMCQCSDLACLRISHAVTEPAEAEDSQPLTTLVLEQDRKVGVMPMVF
jgi:hypothetical protein